MQNNKKLSEIRVDAGIIKGVLKAYYLKNNSLEASRILNLLPRLKDHSVILSALEEIYVKGNVLSFDNLEREIRAYSIRNDISIPQEENDLINFIKREGGESYLVALPESFEFILEKIIDFLKKVEIKKILNAIQNYVINEDEKLNADLFIRTMRAAVERVVNIEAETGKLDYISYDLENLSPRPYIQYVDPSKYIKTGINFIDETLTGGKGLQKGWFVVLSAGTGVGKTVLLTNIAAKAFNYGYRVLYISLEMSTSEIAKRIDSILTGIPINDLTRFEMHDRIVELLRQRIMLRNTNGKKPDLVITYYPSMSLTVHQIPVILDEFKIQGKEFDIVIIDFADYFKTDNKNVPYWEGAAESFLVLPGIARSRDILIITATEINKRDAERDDITLASVYGSSSKAFGADLVLGISRPEGVRDSIIADDTERIIKVLKYRHGQVNQFAKFYIDSSTLNIKEER